METIFFSVLEKNECHSLFFGTIDGSFSEGD